MTKSIHYLRIRYCAVRSICTTAFLIICLTLLYGCFNYDWRQNTLYFTEEQLDSFVPGHTSRTQVKLVATSRAAALPPPWTSVLTDLWPEQSLAEEKILIYSWREWTTMGPRVCFLFSEEGILLEKVIHKDGLWTTSRDKADETVAEWLKRLDLQESSSMADDQDIR